MRRTTAKLVASRFWRFWEIAFVIVTLAVLVWNAHGCVAVTVTTGENNRARSTRDVAHDVSETDATTVKTKADVPISLVPK